MFPNRGIENTILIYSYTRKTKNIDAGNTLDTVSRNRKPENEIIQETEGLRKEITAPEKLNYGRIIADLRYEYEKTIIELKLKSKDLEIENLKLRLKFSTHKF